MARDGTIGSVKRGRQRYRVVAVTATEVCVQVPMMFRDCFGFQRNVRGDSILRCWWDRYLTHDLHIEPLDD